MHMPRSARLATATILLALSASLPAHGAAASEVATPTTPRSGHDVVVKGAGGGTLSLPHFVGDRVSFDLEASAPADRPVDVTGRFRVRHVSPDGAVLAHFRGRVDCLMTGGGVAVVTGVITRGAAPGLPGSQELVGHRVGITVADRGRHDRIGWSWLVMGFHDVPGCTGPAPFFPVTTGHFAVSGPATDLAGRAG